MIRTMKKAITVACFFLGLWFLFHGMVGPGIGFIILWLIFGL